MVYDSKYSGKKLTRLTPIVLEVPWKSWVYGIPTLTQARINALEVSVIVL